MMNEFQQDRAATDSEGEQLPPSPTVQAASVQRGVQALSASELNPPEAVQPVMYALVPGLAGGMSPIDYNTREGKAIWNRATASVMASSNLFDCRLEGLRDFLDCLELRAQEQGWLHTILDIPDDIASPNTTTKTNLIANLSAISLEHLKTVTGRYVQSMSRQNQDSIQLYHCLMHSLSKNGRRKVTLQKEHYTIDGVQVGVLLLKVIIQESVTLNKNDNDNSKIMAIRAQLNNIDTYLANLNFNNNANIQPLASNPSHQTKKPCKAAKKQTKAVNKKQKPAKKQSQVKRQNQTNKPKLAKNKSQVKNQKGKPKNSKNKAKNQKKKVKTEH